MRSSKSFIVGNWTVEPDLDRITRGEEKRTLRPQVMELLIYLAKRDGQVALSEDLFKDLWPGKVVSDATLYNCVAELRHQLDDDVEGSSSIQTIPKKGYRLLLPVRRLDDDDAQKLLGARGRDTRSTSRRSGMIIAAILVISTGYLLVDYLTGQSDHFGVLPADPSIAVLPFVNLSDDAASAYLSDGLSEDLLNLLAKIPGLHVAARTSSFSFRDDANITTSEIAEQLRVTHVLEGSVRKDGSQIRITVQLVDAETGFHVWSERYDRELENIFATQNEIASEVAVRLKSTLLDDLPAARQTDPEVYDLVLKARGLKVQHIAWANVQAGDLLEQALAIDPDYVPAWIELSSVYGNRIDLGVGSPDDARTGVRESLMNALALDPTDAVVHARLSGLHDNVLVQSKHLQRALQIEPRNIEVISAATGLLTRLGRFDEVIAIREYLVSRDPRNPGAHLGLGQIYYVAGRWDGAIRAYSAALKLSPENNYARFYNGIALLMTGETQAALESMLLDDCLNCTVGLPVVYHAMGRSRDSDASLEQLIAQAEQVAAYNIACAYAYRNESNLAFEWLDKAIAYEDVGLHQAWYEPLLSNLHDDARWLPFLERIGLSHEQRTAIEFDFELQLPD